MRSCLLGIILLFREVFHRDWDWGWPQSPGDAHTAGGGTASWFYRWVSPIHPLSGFCIVTFSKDCVTLDSDTARKACGESQWPLPVPFRIPCSRMLLFCHLVPGFDFQNPRSSSQQALTSVSVLASAGTGCACGVQAKHPPTQNKKN